MSDHADFAAAQAEWDADFGPDWWYFITVGQKGRSIALGPLADAEATTVVRLPRPARDADVLRAGMAAASARR
jgi:hypothetical protein